MYTIYVYIYIYISCLDPKWPLLCLEKALFWGVDLQKIEIIDISGPVFCFARQLLLMGRYLEAEELLKETEKDEVRMAGNWKLESMELLDPSGSR